MRGISTRDQETFYQLFKLALISELSETSDKTGADAGMEAINMIDEGFRFHRDVYKQIDLTPDAYTRLLAEKALEEAANMVINSSSFLQQKK
jgi:hypothetical protein